MVSITIYNELGYTKDPLVFIRLMGLFRFIEMGQPLPISGGLNKLLPVHVQPNINANCLRTRLFNTIYFFSICQH